MSTQNVRLRNSNRWAWTLATALLVGAPALASGPLSAPSSGPSGAPTGTGEGAENGAPLSDERASYSFLRTLEGGATVASNGQGIGEDLQRNQPLLTGDLVRVGPGSRAEIALADRNRLHLDADTIVLLERLAFSGDKEERVTVLRLETGELLLEVTEEALGDELPRVITANSTVYVQEPGQYRVETGVDERGEGWTRVVTRSGFAEIVTDRGSSVVRADEAIVAAGSRSPRLDLAAADGPDELERWSEELSGRAVATSRSSRYVEPHLAYDAAPLDEAGDWVEYESVRYWRPYVSSGWRPYWQGRWDWTPSGYTWVSYEPWGWVPYHYGRWCSLPGYGWAWRPGAVYSPAWVYWNWTSGYAGWVPMGYYSQFYNPWYGDSFRYGHYGWSGGGWGIYSDWNFAPVHCFRDRNFRGRLRTGRDLQHESRLPEPPRGLLTTDTREFRPEKIDRTEDLLHQIGKRNRVNVGQDLPDVTDFVGRKGRLPTDLARIVVHPIDKGGKGGRGSGVIRDIERNPPSKVAEVPAWRESGKPGAGGVTRDSGGRAGEKEPPVSASGRGGKGGDSAAGPIVILKPRQAAPVGPSSSPSGPAGPADRPVRAPGVKSSGIHPPAAPTSGGKAYGTKGVPPSGDDRQMWRSKGTENEPVQRVVGSVRRPAPGKEATVSAPSGRTRSIDSPKGGDPYARSPSTPSASPGGRKTPVTSAPDFGEVKTNRRAEPVQPSRPSQPSQPSPRYREGSARPASPYGGSGKVYSGDPGTAPSPGSRGRSTSSQPSPGYGKGGATSQPSTGYGKGSGTPQPSPGYERRSGGSQPAPGSVRGGGGGGSHSAKPPSGSAGSQSSAGSGRSHSGSSAGKTAGASSGARSQKSPPPPPPPPKKDDGKQ